MLVIVVLFVDESLTLNLYNDTNTMAVNTELSIYSSVGVEPAVTSRHAGVQFLAVTIDN